MFTRNQRIMQLKLSLLVMMIFPVLVGLSEYKKSLNEKIIYEVDLKETSGAIFVDEVEVVSIKGTSPWDEIAEYAVKLETAFGVNDEQSRVVAEIVLLSARTHNVPFEVIAGVIEQESRYEPTAVSSVGALGYSQIRPEFWENVCPYNIRDPRGNIMCAGFVLSHYYESECGGRWHCAVRAYNVGPTGLAKSHDRRRSSWRYMVRVQSHIDKINDYGFALIAL